MGTLGSYLGNNMLRSRVNSNLTLLYLSKIEEIPKVIILTKCSCDVKQVIQICNV